MAIPHEEGEDEDERAKGDEVEVDVRHERGADRERDERHVEPLRDPLVRRQQDLQRRRHREAAVALQRRELSLVALWQR